MKTPVIIAAYHESEYIGRTLEGLREAECEPIVAINGEPENGPTAQIARQFEDVTVLEREEQGKLPSIKQALHYLGRRALEPVILLDADSYPLFPAKWAGTMTSLVAGNVPATATAPTYAARENTGMVKNALQNVRVAQRAAQVTLAHKPGPYSGRNLAVYIQSADLLDEIMDLPPTWPGEDLALSDLVAGGEAKHRFSPSPYASVMTSNRYKTGSLVTRLFNKAEYFAQRDANYKERVAPGTDYWYKDGQFHAYAGEPDFSLDDILHRLPDLWHADGAERD